MPSKTEEYLALAQRTANGLTRYWEHWTDYLTTASRLYKYSFADQLMIYAQRPDATACASFDIWNNRMNRYVRRGSKGIALLDQSSSVPRLHYVFDVSDTGVRRNSRDPEVWQLNDDLFQPVSEMLARYMQLHPKAQLRIISENSRTLIALLRRRMLDLAIVDSPFPGNEFNSLLLDTDYLTAAVPNGSPLADAGHISLAQLKKEKLILRPAGSGTRTLFEASLKKRGMSLEQFNVMMEADSVSTIKRLVESSYGISVLSARACMGAVEEGRFRVLPISDLNMVRRIHICYRKDFGHPGFLGELRKLYATTMKSLPEQG